MSRGMSQRGMAKSLGIAQPSLRSIELGIKPPGRSLLLKFYYTIDSSDMKSLILLLLYYNDSNLNITIDTLEEYTKVYSSLESIVNITIES